MLKKKNFVLVGAAGFVAKRHIQVIKETRNNLVAAVDVNDSIGILDNFFPKCIYLKKIDEIKKLKKKIRIDYLVVCTPNHLHRRHIEFGIKNKINVICEKPFVISTNDFKKIINLEKKSKKTINVILQLRHHPSLKKLKNKIKTSKKIHKVSLNYVTSRGDWYFKSWKGNEKKSGGILMNIGIHFFDMLIWIFGDLIYFNIDYLHKNKAKGSLKLQKANVKWKLSLDKKDIPKSNKSKISFRSIKVDNKELEFSEKFNFLHKKSYQSILNSNKSNYISAYKSINLIEKIKKF